MAKLSEAQWAEIMQRHIVGGEKVRILAAEFGVSPNAIRLQRSSREVGIKAVAKQIVDTEKNLRELPVASQLIAVDLAAKLRSISAHIADAATNGAETAARLSRIAAQQVGKIDPLNPMDGQEDLQAISALTKMANDSASLGMALINANKNSPPVTSLPGGEESITIEQVAEVIESVRDKF